MYDLLGEPWKQLSSPSSRAHSILSTLNAHCVLDFLGDRLLSCLPRVAILLRGTLVNLVGDRQSK